ncbi:hypothetical protein [Pseudoduganella sp. RAF53_2]|uniref:hypothetical protein n=1 Tax=unclassified Pseudoduganella TaxID=2637179 RepID=UPI003F999E01
MPAIKNNLTGDVTVVALAPQLVAGIWECGDHRFTDPDGTHFEPIAVAPTVTPMEFLMLFTATERISIKSAVAGKPGATPPVPADVFLADWWSIVTDPRLKEVILGLDSVRQAIAYLVQKGHVADERQADILAGRIL